jgi:hypothetical protein
MPTFDIQSKSGSHLFRGGFLFSQLLVKPDDMQNVFFPGFPSHSQGFPGEVVTKEIKSFLDPADEGLVGVLPEFDAVEVAPQERYLFPVGISV